MSQPCASAHCKKTSCALCYCCQKGLCLQHLKEHNNVPVSQLNPLVDQVNAINDRLTAINIEHKTGDCRRKLEQWRNDCHKQIDDLFEQKCKEIIRRLTGKVKKQKKEIDQIQSTVTALIREEEVSRQDIDLLTSTIRDLDQEVNKIEHSGFIIKIQPVIIDDNFIQIEESNLNDFDLSKLPPAYETISSKGKGYPALASNGRFLLMHRAPDLCMIDQELTIVHQTTWDYTGIRNMCWSSSLNRFIIISVEGVFSIDEKTMSIDKLQIVQEQGWFSCTCSDSSLFLSTYNHSSPIMEYRLLPSVELIKEWKSPETCQSEEWISDMKYNNGSIALTIMKPSQKKIFIQLRNIHTLDQLWSFQLDNMNLQEQAVRCCILNGEEWLVLGNEFDRLVHLTKDGKMKSSCAYEPKAYGASIFGPDIIAIATTNSVNFHKLQ